MSWLSEPEHDDSPIRRLLATLGKGVAQREYLTVRSGPDACELVFRVPFKTALGEWKGATFAPASSDTLRGQFNLADLLGSWPHGPALSATIPVKGGRRVLRVRAHVDFGDTVAARAAALQSVSVLALDPGRKQKLTGAVTSLAQLATNGLSLPHSNYLLKLGKKLYDSVARPKHLRRIGALLAAEEHRRRLGNEPVGQASVLCGRDACKLETRMAPSGTGLGTVEPCATTEIWPTRRWWTESPSRWSR